jgi:hypothetical protein
MLIVKMPDGSNLPGKAQNHVALRTNSQVNLVGFLGRRGKKLETRIDNGSEPVAISKK